MKKIIIIGGTEFLGFHTVNFFLKKKFTVIGISRNTPKKIRGVCLDVFDVESLAKNSLFKKYTNCILSSHNAFNTKDEVEFVNRNTLNNIFKGLDLNAENIKKF